MIPGNELTPFYEEGKLIENDAELEASIELTIMWLNKEGKGGQFTLDAVRMLKDGYKDAQKDGYRGPSYGG